MRTQIKICGLTREHDVDTAVHAGADAIGFVLYAPSPRAVTLQRAAELARRLPPFVTPVLLFVNESIEGVQRALGAIPGAIAQFHGDEPPETCVQAAHHVGRRYLKAARIPLGPAGKGFDLVKFCLLHHQADAILLDAHVDGFGGGGKAFDWSLLPLNVNAHLVLSGGLTHANVIDGILNVRPRCRSLAVDVSSGVEVAKGIKSPALIHPFISAVRQADNLPS
jgi:phosphoribosylanthranilate isomerase